MALSLDWVKCVDDEWCSLGRVDLTNVNVVGVYIIWRAGRCVYVGQGDIADRLTSHRSDPTITRHGQSGTLCVTWAQVRAESNLDGVERYLAEQYKPLEGTNFPDVTPLPVNLPGS